MGALELQQLLRRKPFIPIRLTMSDDRTYIIRHPDQCGVARTYMMLLIPDQGDIADRFEYLSLVHLVRVEDLPQATSPLEGNSAA